MDRRQMTPIRQDLEKKIVLLTGPRQVGKTWLAREMGKHYPAPVYLSYDHFEDRGIIERQSWLRSTSLLILDELHKMPGWQTYLKGLYDTRPPHLKLLVTGSAGMDTFRHAGDSLAGRFFRHRLLPFSPAELKGQPASGDIDRFLQRSGFPEPFLAESDSEAERWRQQYLEGLLRIDAMDYGGVSQFRTLQLIAELLRRRVGSPVSCASIARDVQASPLTVAKYVQILEALYIVFRVAPYSRNIARSLLKEPKLYFYDTGLVVGDAGARFENFVAVCLLKHVYGLMDYQGQAWELKYLRTKDGKEADFCLVRDGEPISLIEAKHGDASLSANLAYFCDKYALPGVQVVKEARHEQSLGRVDIRQAETYLRELYL